MTIKLCVTAVEAYDELNELAFTVKMLDDACVEIDIKALAHTDESWREMSGAIAKAIALIDIERGAK